MTNTIQKPPNSATALSSKVERMVAARWSTVRCNHHCAKCNKHFTSLAAFDAHIGRPGFHYEPAERKHLRIRATDGECRLSDPTLDSVTVWEYVAGEKALEPAWDDDGGRPEGLPF